MGQVKSIDINVRLFIFKVHNYDGAKHVVAAIPLHSSDTVGYQKMRQK